MKKLVKLVIVLTGLASIASSVYAISQVNANDYNAPEIIDVKLLELGQQ